MGIEDFRCLSQKDSSTFKFIFNFTFFSDFILRKFNSLFDNDVSQKNTDYYMVDTTDTTLLLSKLILGEDVGKSRAVEILGSRNFGN